MATFKDTIDGIRDGEEVNASTANRPLTQLNQNDLYLRARLDQVADGEALFRRAVVLDPAVLVGQPVYWNSLSGQYEKALAEASAKANVEGFVLSKASAALGDLLILGSDSLDLTNALNGSPLAAGQYYLSTTLAGTITATSPGPPNIRVCVADGAGRVFAYTQIPDLRGFQGFQGSQGRQGFQGSQGFQGFQGVQGAQGFQGFQGAQGVQGSQGNQGAQGNQGFQGFQGFQGLTGSGSQGSQGVTGTQGFQGDTGGAQGAQGSQGAAGGQGSQGNQGFQGSQGNQGFQGLTGTGSQGNQGFQGNTGGAQGFQGFQGAQGAQGNQGFQGTAGSGAQGAQGAQGTAGAGGAQGNQGFQGFQGFQGTTGTAGSQGSQGNQGFQGFQGATGTTGSQGSQGNQGFQGAQGVQGAQGMGVQGIQGGFLQIYTDPVSALPGTSYASVATYGDGTQVSARMTGCVLVGCQSAVNGMTYRFVVKDTFGNQGVSSDITLAALGRQAWDMADIPTGVTGAYPPFRSIEIDVKNTVPGSQSACGVYPQLFYTQTTSFISEP